jgi:lysophospholipase L1-like esterase
VSRRFLALGDSYTIGEGVDVGDGWPGQLARALRETGVSIDDPEIVATTGWTTDELVSAIEGASLRPPFDLVTLLDHYRGCDVFDYGARFRTVLARAVELAGNDAERVLVISIPDWGVTPFASSDPRGRGEIGREIDRFNVTARAAAESTGVRWVNVTPVSRRAGDDPTLLAPDGLHPSGAMYAEWVELILPHAVAAVRR